METRGPDFVGIGFMRCASTWLHRCLFEHPDIGKSPSGVHYFSEFLEKGANWYWEQFIAHQDKEVIVDFSISYAFPGNVSTFITELPRLLPNAPLFAIVRNPVERAYSDYRRSLFKEELDPNTTFERALDEVPDFLERGRYARILGQVCKELPDRELQLYFYDDVKERPMALWAQICSYLRVTSDFIPSVLQTQIGHLSRPRNQHIHQSLRLINRRVTTIAQKLGLGDSWIYFKRTGLWRRMIDLSIGQTNGMAFETRRRLSHYYTDDVDYLEELTGRNLENWRI